MTPDAPLPHRVSVVGGSSRHIPATSRDGRVAVGIGPSVSERGRTDLAEEDWDDDAPTAVFRVGHDTPHTPQDAPPEALAGADSSEGSERVTLVIEDYRELLALANAHSR